MKVPTKKTDKIFFYIAILVTTGSFFTTFFELPPATFLIELYCRIFDTDSYPVTLIGLILILIILIPLALLKKLYDNKIAKVENQ